MAHRILKGLLNAQPFVPFVVTTTDGRQFRVNHPEFAALSRIAMSIYPDGDAPHVEISLLHIVSAEKEMAPEGAAS